MHTPDQLRIWATDLRAHAAHCSDADHKRECLLLSEQYEELAQTTEQFMQALEAKGDTPLWRVRAKAKAGARH
jgi:hypothetical protein